MTTRICSAFVTLDKLASAIDEATFVAVAGGQQVAVMDRFADRFAELQGMVIAGDLDGVEAAYYECVSMARTILKGIAADEISITGKIGGVAL